MSGSTLGRPVGSRSLLLIQAGTPPEDIRSITGDLPQWFLAAMGMPADSVKVVRVFEDQPLPKPGAYPAAVITSSWSMVTDRLAWSEATAAWIRESVALGTPILGVCYGHQLMAHALGGKVDYLPSRREMGCLDIERLPAGSSDPWLAGIPTRFKAHLTHMQTVVSLPNGAQALASSAQDPHQIVRYSPTAVSVQFHPEFTSAIQTACINARAGVLRSEGRDPVAMLSALAATPAPLALLQRFVETYAAAATNT